MSEFEGVTPGMVQELTAILAELSDLEQVTARLRAKIETLVAAQAQPAAVVTDEAPAAALDAVEAGPVTAEAAVTEQAILTTEVTTLADAAEAQVAIDAGSVTEAAEAESAIAESAAAPSEGETVPLETDLALVAMDSAQSGSAGVDAEVAAGLEVGEAPVAAAAESAETAGLDVPAPAVEVQADAVTAASVAGILALGADAIIVPALAAAAAASVAPPKLVPAARQPDRQFGAAFAGAACVLVTSAMVLASYMLGSH